MAISKKDELVRQAEIAIVEKMVQSGIGDLLNKLQRETGCNVAELGINTRFQKEQTEPLSYSVWVTVS